MRLPKTLTQIHLKKVSFIKITLEVPYQIPKRPMKSKAKTIFNFLIFIFLGTYYCSSQNMVFDWATAYINSPNALRPERMAAQSNGITLMGARLDASVDADLGLGTSTVTKDHNSGQVYISFDPDGQFLWANKLESDDVLTTTSMVATINGSFYVVGNFSTNLIATIGGVEQTITDSGYGSGFLAKFSATGQIEFIKNFVGTYAQNFAVDVDGSGNVFIGGYFYDALFYPAGTNEPSNYLDVFVVKLNTSGDFQWIYRTEGAAGKMPDYQVNDIKVDSNGNINLWGSYREPNSYNLDFEEGPGVTEIASTDQFSSFLLQINSSGNFNWVKSYMADAGPLPREVLSESMALDSNDNIYIYGSAYGLVAFDDANPTVKTDFSATNTEGFFLLKLSKDGVFIWLDPFEVYNGLLQLSQITIAPDNTILITGAFIGSIDFDHTTGEQIIDNSTSYTDIFFSKFQTDGSLLQAFNIGRSDATDTAHDVVTDDYGNIYGTASCSTGSSGSFFIGNIELSGANIRYVYKIRSCGAESVTQIDASTLRSNFSNASYQWLDCNNGNIPISGETNRTFTPTASGSYALETTSYNCGTEISPCFDLVTLGLNDFTKTLSAYPNPTDGIVSIDLGTAHSNLNVTVVNSLGQKISSKFFKSAEKIDVVLPSNPGVYFIKLNNNKLMTTIKIIKK
ncbi:T9SS type A sorting domain-containing protein [Mariniflexile sp. HMF6888]|uniref:T9SS type A sorting domain-containing protein n=1 Tax=Mariniflexile sp. HMF6888 TaxID=3373086 RepID=UPI00378E48D9